MASTQHVSILDTMRGIAALAVVLFHYSGYVLPSIVPNYFTDVFAHGNLGVQVFFVISGFVIPFALHRARYSISDFGNFMLRRWARIAPPAYIAALFMVLYYLLALAINGRPIDGWDFPGFGPIAIFANLTFTGEYFNGNWYNFVFWSLNAELEFYIIIGLIYPLLMVSKRPWLPAATVAVMLLVCQTADRGFFRYVEYFAFGMIVFLYKEKRITGSHSVILILLCCVLGITSGKLLATSVGLLTTAVIHFGTQFNTRITSWLGAISYSLYITHVPIGYFAESALRRVMHLHEFPAGKVIMLLLYTIISLIGAWVFYRIVEMPFMKWSKALAKRRPVIDGSEPNIPRYVVPDE